MELDMVMLNCANCGMSYAIPQAIVTRLKECHNTFYCPAGHGNHFPQKTSAEILKETVAAQSQEIARLVTANKELQKKLPKKQTRKPTKKK